MYEDLCYDLRLDKSEVSLSPFVYVDIESGEIKLLTNLYSDSEEELTALSVVSGGSMEFLTTEE